MVYTPAEIPKFYTLGDIAQPFRAPKFAAKIHPIDGSVILFDTNNPAGFHVQSLVCDTHKTSLRREGPTQDGLGGIYVCTTPNCPTKLSFDEVFQ